MGTDKTYRLGDIDFIVDIEYGMLRHPTAEHRVISFHNMEADRDCYFLDFDKERGIQADGFTKPENLLHTTVPFMVTLDPEETAKRYSIDVKDLPSRDTELRTNPEILQRRKDGKLPIFFIKGYPFYVDLRMNCLRPKDDFSTLGIELNRLPMDDSGTAYLCYYDPKTHSEAIFDEGMTKLPNDKFMIEIPYELILDPYGYLRDADISFNDDWFRNFPVRLEMNARVRPWEKTGLPNIIAENRKKQESQKQKKGRGIR